MKPSVLAWILCAGLCVPGCIGSPEPAGQGAQSAPQVGTKVATAPANGWGDKIAWRGLTEGLHEAKSQGRPLMLVVHASWCTRCKELKTSFQNAELLDLTDNFVMVNVDQDQTPRAEQEFAPDGAYLPRVVFVDPQTGQPDRTLLNTRRPRNRYFYTPRDDLVGTMKKALARHGKA